MAETPKIISPGELPSALKAAFARIYSLETEIDDLKAEHITPLADEKTAAWRDLKASTDIARKDLDLYYRLYRRARDADDMDDSDEGKRIRDNLKRVFQALQQGQTLDWIGALDQAAEGEKKPAPKAAKGKAAPVVAAPPAPKEEAPPAEALPPIATAEAKGGPRGPGEETVGAPDADWQDPTATADDSEFDDAGHVFNSGRTAALEGAAADANPHTGGTVKAATWARGWEKGNAERTAEANGGEVVALNPVRKPRGRKPEAEGVTTIDGVEYHQPSADLGASRPAFPH